MTDPYALKIASFVARALELDADPNVMAGEIVALKRDVNAGISSLELSSAEGPAPFLIYHYLLAQADDDGVTGQAIFDRDLETLTRATTQNTPGPRILAHATTDGEAFVLATTPDVFESLTGVESATEPPPAAAMPGKAAMAIRKDASDGLLRLLRDADSEAQRWLGAIRANADPNESIQLEAEESALALFLLDSRSLKNIFQVINLLIENAQEQAEKAMKNGDS